MGDDSGDDESYNDDGQLRMSLFHSMKTTFYICRLSTYVLYLSNEVPT